MKRMSVVGNDGTVKWVQREVTCLVCPGIRPDSVNSEKAKVNTSVSVGTNKKQRISFKKCMDQSGSQDPIMKQ